METRDTGRYVLEFNDETHGIKFTRKGDGMVVDGPLDRNPFGYSTVKSNYLENFDDGTVNAILDDIFRIREKKHEAVMVK